VSTPKWDTGAAAEEPAERLLHIYEVQARWHERRPEGEKPYPTDYHDFPDLPSDRRGNAMQSFRWYREPLSDEDTLAKEVIALILGRYADRDPQEVTAVVTYTHVETWACEWFSHSQPDWGDDDATVLAGFNRYVNRVERFNRQNRQAGASGYSFDPICLMGAEDFWRYRGAKKDGSAANSAEESPPPCRCDGCRKLGLVRINH
jgi:hypothetical protein